MSTGLTPPWFIQSFVDSSGNPLNGGRLYFFVAGSTTLPKNVYSDYACTIPVTQPLVLDSSGTADQYFMESGLYKIVVNTRTDTLVNTRDNVEGSSGGSSTTDSYQVKVQSTDLTAAYLSNKLVNGNGVGVGITLDNTYGEQLFPYINETWLSTWLVNQGYATGTPSDHMVSSISGGQVRYLAAQLTDSYNNVFVINASGQTVIDTTAYFLKTGGVINGDVSVSGALNSNIINTNVLNTANVTATGLIKTPTLSVTSSISLPSTESYLVLGDGNFIGIDYFLSTYGNHITGFLPLTAGSSYPLTGELYGTYAAFSGSVTAIQFVGTDLTQVGNIGIPTQISGSTVNIVGALSVTTATFSDTVTVKRLVISEFASTDGTLSVTGGVVDVTAGTPMTSDTLKAGAGVNFTVTGGKTFVNADAAFMSPFFMETFPLVLADHADSAGDYTYASIKQPELTFLATAMQCWVVSYTPGATVQFALYSNSGNLLAKTNTVSVTTTGIQSTALAWDGSGNAITDITLPGGDIHYLAVATTGTVTIAYKSVSQVLGTSYKQAIYSTSQIPTSLGTTSFGYAPYVAVLGG